MSVLLVDGSALAYRSYYAFIRNPLRTRSGEETSLTFGFLNSLLRLLKRFDPKHVAIVFDRPGKTFRHEIDPEYKAGRPPMPSSMKEQFPRLFEALQALRLPVLQEEGVEADDVLGTLAKRFGAAGEMVYLLSGDKDFLQLVEPRIKMLRFQRASSDVLETGPDQVTEELGIQVDQVVDYMALMGDSVDNVPGVKGIGPKTARRLISEYGSLTTLYENLESLTPLLCTKLKSGRDAAFRSQELVRIVTDLKLPEAPESFARQDPDMDAVRDLLQTLEFTHLMQLLPQSNSMAAVIEFEWIESSEKLQEALARLAKCKTVALYCAFEKEGSASSRPYVMGLAGPGTPVWILSLDRETAELPSGVLPFEEEYKRVLGPTEIFGKLSEFFSTPFFSTQHFTTQRQLLGHDLKRLSLSFTDQPLDIPLHAFDCMLASYVLDPSRKQHGLSALAETYLGEPLPSLKPETSRTVAKPGRDPQASALMARHMQCLFKLQERLRTLLSQDNLLNLFETVEMPLTRVLLTMQRSGVCIDESLLEALSSELEHRCGELEGQIFELAQTSFNLNSPKQLGEILFEKLKLSHGRKTKTGWSTDVSVLESLAEEHPLPSLVLEYRQLSKLQSTYTRALPKLVRADSHRVHTSFNQAVASTGRLSSSEPNLQNIPVRSELGRRIRRAFVPQSQDWVLLSADYSQIELRILADLSGDRVLRQAFLDETDVHVTTAARIYGCEPAKVLPEQRAAAKTVNFGVIYGMGARGLSQQLGITVDAAKQFIQDYFDSYPSIRDYIEKVVAAARDCGYVTTILGRRLKLADITSSHPGRRAFAERVAVNAPIQGSAADLIKLAMLRIDALLQQNSCKTKMIVQVHDELLFEVPKVELQRVQQWVVREMENAMELAVPLRVDVGIGNNWDEAH